MHAPEPWTCLRADEPEYFVQLITSPAVHVASIASRSTFGATCPISEANARLICNAPAMLRIIKRLLQWNAFTGGWEAECWREAKILLAELETARDLPQTEGQEAEPRTQGAGVR